MRARSIFVLLIAGCSRQPIGNQMPDGAQRVPLRHRPVATACGDAPRPAGNCGGRPDLGLPDQDECNGDVSCTNGMNGRCVAEGISLCHCSYDDCRSDSDCLAGSLCDCRDEWVRGFPEGPNRCLPSDCRIDSDCGAGGYCSPSLDPQCGTFSGITLWHCHTPKDECIDDSDCAAIDGGYVTPFCAWAPELGHWACSIAQCLG